jgi:hypothetical protein
MLVNNPPGLLATTADAIEREHSILKRPHHASRRIRHSGRLDGMLLIDWSESVLWPCSFQETGRLLHKEHPKPVRAGHLMGQHSLKRVLGLDAGRGVYGHRQGVAGQFQPIARC